MRWMKSAISVTTRGKGLHPITGPVSALLHGWGVQEGMLHLYCPHTSASLLINEDYEPTARADMEAFLERLLPEAAGWYRHTLEGPDDAPSHLRAMLTPVSLSIPVDGGRLSLGTWQGIFLFEHRAGGLQRQVMVRCLDTLA